jgi:hypothetical protein
MKQCLNVSNRLGVLIVSILAGVTMLPAATVRAGQASRDGYRVHIFSKGTKTTTKNLIDHGGPVLPTTTAYVIYWGNVPTDVSDALATFLGGFGGSSYANILTQYMRGGSVPETSYAPLAPDPSSPPVRSPKVSTIVNEVCHTLGNTLPDPNGIYFVVTGNFPKGGGFCAWHSFGTCNGVSIPIVYLPNVTGVSVCDIVSDPGNPFMNGGQSMANDAAHELSESITDPFISAWYDQSGAEVGDKCQTQYGSPVRLSDGTEWSLQEEWSNNASGCIQSLP